MPVEPTVRDDKPGEAAVATNAPVSPATASEEEGACGQYVPSEAESSIEATGEARQGEPARESEPTERERRNELN